jgi:hypothetical protein
MRFFSTSFYMLLSILGLSVISLGGLIGAQFYRGKLSLGDLHSIMRVIGGTNRIMIPNDAYDRYLTFAKDEEAARAELELNRGLPQTRVPAAMRARETQQAQQDNLDVQNRLLEEQKRLVTQLRGEVDAQKRQVETLIRSLDNEREKNAIVAKDATTANLRKMLSETDAAVLGTYLTEVIRDPSQGGPTEAARVMRDHLKADFTAEVIATLPAAERQRVIPLLENQFAGVPPDAVVQIFNDRKMSAGEMLVHLMQMNPNQALGVYLRLPSNMQEQLSPQLLRN